MMPNDTSHIAYMRRQYAYNVKQVLWLTGMTEDELNDFMFRTGLDWLAHYTKDDKDMLAIVLKSEIIWKWWVNEWYIRDHKRFLSALYVVNDKRIRLTRYRVLHQNIFTECTPPYELLADEYTRLVSDFNKSVIKAAEDEKIAQESC